MAVEIAYDPRKQIAVMFCNTSNTAFGPVFDDAQAAEDFVDWLRENGTPHWSVADAGFGDGRDPRDYSPGELERLVNFYLGES